MNAYLPRYCNKRRTNYDLYPPSNVPDPNSICT
ncbi:hypothetical protein T05_4290 [Trichinella murrelli]|uniref:Uncharacterized protein n=1 Tax=Trichinella murrelli TaxID=144512 RepID=A0A0V0SZ50_9BILA|nr:hypothetical protein T05_4290 [Trichinella murrelli]